MMWMGGDACVARRHPLIARFVRIPESGRRKRPLPTSTQPPPLRNGCDDLLQVQICSSLAGQSFCLYNTGVIWLTAPCHKTECSCSTTGGTYGRLDDGLSPDATARI